MCIEVVLIPIHPHELTIGPCTARQIGSLLKDFATPYMGIVYDHMIDWIIQDVAVHIMNMVVWFCQEISAVRSVYVCMYSCRPGKWVGGEQVIWECMIIWYCYVL